MITEARIESAFKPRTILFIMLLAVPWTVLSGFSFLRPAMGSLNITDPSPIIRNLGTGDGWIPCARCEGKGHYKVVCDLCYGKREISCPYFGGMGKIDCPCCCGEGKIRWKQSGSTDPCKFCSKGRINCPFCAGKKVLPCPRCQKKGKIQKDCDACLGLGGFPSPRADPTHPCPACDGSKLMPCFACFGEGKIPKPCKACKGYGVVRCERCIGGRIVCEGCGGAGRQRFVYRNDNTKAGSQKCSICKGRGYEKCSECKGKGRFSCSVYDGFDECSECSISPGYLPCTVCAKSKN